MTVDYTQPPSTTLPPPPPAPPGTWWSRNWKWVIVVGCLLPILLLGGCIAGLVFIVFKAIQSSDVYTEAVSRAQTHTEVRARLGEPITPKCYVTGNIDASHDGGEANFTIPIAGPKGEGTIRVIGTKSGGEWTYQTMSVRIDNETINLLEDPSPPEWTDTAPPGD